MVSCGRKQTVRPSTGARPYVKRPRGQSLYGALDAVDAAAQGVELTIRLQARASCQIFAQSANLIVLVPLVASRTFLDPDNSSGKHFLTTTTPSMLKLYSSVVEGREAAAADKVGDRSHRAAPVAISSASILVAGEM